VFCLGFGKGLRSFRPCSVIGSQVRFLGMRACLGLCASLNSYSGLSFLEKEKKEKRRRDTELSRLFSVAIHSFDVYEGGDWSSFGL
jgi:hypothetical protein